MLEIGFSDDTSLTAFIIVVTLAQNFVDRLVISPPGFPGATITLSCHGEKIRAVVDAGDNLSWDFSTLNIEIATIPVQPTFPPVKVRPTFDSTTSTVLLSHRESYSFLRTTLARKITQKAFATLPPSSFDRSKIYTGIALSVLFDLAYCSDPRVLFVGLQPLKICDFAHAIALGSEHFLSRQLDAFARFVPTFTVTDTPLLHYASLVCHSAALMRLICGKCQISSIDHPKHGRTAVFYALRNPCGAILQTLIEFGIDLDLCDASHNSPLTECLAMGDRTRAKFLLENGASVHRTLSDKYSSGLEWAIKRRDGATLRLLLRFAGDEVNAPDGDGRFLAHVCLSNGWAKGLRITESSSDVFNPNLSSDLCPHPLHYLIDNMNQGWNEKQTSVATVLSLAKLDPNELNKEGETALIRGVKTHLSWLVQLLATDPRCDLNAYNREGMTALYCAVAANDQDMARQLMNYGAFVNQPNENGDTPLNCAVTAQNVALTRILIEGGAKPNHWYFKGKLPVHVATAETLAVLMSAGAQKGAMVFN
jgi:ankyrin repeat protein